MADGIDVLPIVLYSVFAALVLFSNSIVIIVIIKSRELHLPTLWSIAFMAAWDFALGLHFIVFIVPSKILNAFAYPDDCGLIATKLLTFIVIQNIMNIVLALVDRYIAVAWPLHYQQLMSGKRFICAVTSLFLINITRLCILINIKADDAIYDKALGMFASKKFNTKASITIGFAVIGVSIIFVLLIRIYLELRKSRPNMARSHDCSHQFTFTVFLSTVLYIVSNIPSIIYVLITNITGYSNSTLFHVGTACVLSNSLWNVFIYAFTYRPFRDAFLKIVCPTFVRERERREVQVQFQKNWISAFTVEGDI